MQHKIIFRGDGSAKLGYGHIHRLLALVQMLYQKFDCVFISHEASHFLIETLEDINVPFLQIPGIKYNIPDARKENEEVVFDMDSLLKGNEIVVLDGYWFGKEYQQAIKNRGCIVVYIDDLMLPGNIADCIINHSPGISISDYKQLAPASSVYVGSRYSLINISNKFRHQHPHPNGFSRLLIAMGGADPQNFTCKVILAHKAFIQRFIKLVVLVGNVYAYSKALQDAVADVSNVKLIHGLPKTEMLALMQQSSAAIISASTMAVEYAHVGGALAIIQTAENQKNIFKGLIESGVAVSLEQISVLTQAAATGMQKKQQEIFDGKSGERFINLFQELQLQAGFSFIKAAPEHLQVTYQWASNQTVRAYSFNQNPIVFEEHKNWFLKKIVENNCIYLLGKWENNIVGSLRFNIANNAALISYLVSPQFQGKGLGRIMLAKGLEYLATSNTNVIVANGYVMPQNIASVKVFKRLGFDCTTENNQLLFSKKIYR